MPCLNPDGTLTPTSRAVLEALDAAPCQDSAVSEQAGLPLWRVRASLRELGKAELVGVQDNVWSLTDLGHEALEIDRSF
ncbi:MAG: hypothetical protein Alpg2KO_32870 [Alphaproteobacteria bacterium]